MLKEVVLMACLVFPVLIWSSFIFVSDDSRFELVRNKVKPKGWAEQVHHNLKPDSFQIAFERILSGNPPKEGILVLSFNPELYLRFRQRCASRYTNFSIAYYKISSWKHNYAQYLISGPEELSEVYSSFENEKPDYIVDPDDLFGQLREQLPLLLHPYRKTTVEGTIVYVLDRSRIYPLFWDNV